MVTAGGGGIGAVIAHTFAVAGARVHTCDISREALDALAERSSTIAGTVVDLGDEAAIVNWCDLALKDLGGVDILVNNAGIAGPTADVEDVSLEDWRQCLAIDLDSHFLTCRAVVPVMKDQRSGSIINMSSTAGQVGYGRRTPYAAAKWAVIGFTKSLAIEVGPYGVRANAICPGAVRGERMGRVIAAEAAARGLSEAEVEAEYASSQSIARFVDPQEIADMAYFLASPESRMVSGQAIAVDGHTETYHIYKRLGRPSAAFPLRGALLSERTWTLEGVLRMLHCAIGGKFTVVQQFEGVDG
jgi:NAD(P)-dependent dehydrogenase (short-subunit alcohol dehydrogenase family)